MIGEELTDRARELGFEVEVIERDGVPAIVLADERRVFGTCITGESLSAVADAMRRRLEFFWPSDPICGAPTALGSPCYVAPGEDGLCGIHRRIAVERKGPVRQWATLKAIELADAVPRPGVAYGCARNPQTHGGPVAPSMTAAPGENA